MPHAAARRALILLVVAFSAQAQPLYKWVDEKGVTQYSQSPPPEGAKGAAKLEFKVPPQPPGFMDDWKTKEMMSKQKKAKEEVAGEKTRQHEAVGRRDRCHDATERLDLYRAQIPVYRMNEKGERVYMDDSDRPAAIARAQADVEKYCNR